MGDSSSDMVQDLNDLSELGKANLDLVNVAGISARMLDNDANVSDAIGNIGGATNGERQTDSEAMIIRDKAFSSQNKQLTKFENVANLFSGETPTGWKAIPATIGNT